LTILGFTFTAEQIKKEEQAIKHIAQMKEAKKAKRRAKKEAGGNTKIVTIEQDDRFYYIVGYTSGGVPYGVTWEEMGLEPYEKCSNE